MSLTTYFFNTLWTLLRCFLDTSLYIKSIIYRAPSEKEVYLVRSLQLGIGMLYEYKVITPSKDYYLCVLPHIKAIDDISFHKDAQLHLLKLSNSIVHCNLSSNSSETMIDLTNELRKFVLFFDNNSVMMSTFLSYVYAIHAESAQTFHKLQVYLNDDDFTECTYSVDELCNISFPQCLKVV